MPVDRIISTNVTDTVIVPSFGLEPIASVKRLVFSWISTDQDLLAMREKDEHRMNDVDNLVPSSDELNTLLAYLSQDDLAKMAGDLAHATVLLIREGDSQSIVRAFYDWLATAELVGDADALHDLLEARRELAQGESIPWETIRQRLGL